MKRRINKPMTALARLLLAAGKWHWYCPHFEKMGYDWEIRMRDGNTQVYVYG